MRVKLPPEFDYARVSQATSFALYCALTRTGTFGSAAGMLGARQIRGGKNFHKKRRISRERFGT
jgi:hypothetical protein